MTEVDERVSARTEAGRILLDAFSVEPESPDFAVRISQNSILRHAIPHIEAEAAAVDVGALHRALWAVGESQLRYVIEEGKFLEAASLIAVEYARLIRGEAGTE